jgi:hypothetical protein
MYYIVGVEFVAAHGQMDDDETGFRNLHAPLLSTRVALAE